MATAKAILGAIDKLGRAPARAGVRSPTAVRAAAQARRSTPRAVRRPTRAGRAAGYRTPRPVQAQNRALAMAQRAGMPGGSTRRTANKIRQAQRGKMHGPPAPTPTDMGRKGKSVAQWVRSNPGKTALGVGGGLGLYAYSNSSGRSVDRTNYATSRGIYGY